MWDSLPTISRFLVPTADQLLNHYAGATPNAELAGCWFPRTAASVDMSLNSLIPLLQDNDGCRWFDLEPFLYELGAAQGADPTRAADLGTPELMAHRRGEPFGELGLVTPYDGNLWRDQILRAPSDPPSTLAFVRRDVWSSAATEDGTLIAQNDGRGLAHRGARASGHAGRRPDRRFAWPDAAPHGYRGGHRRQQRRCARIVDA